MLEITLIKLCKPAMETSNDAVVARLQSLEDKVENGVIPVAPAQNVTHVSENAPAQTKAVLPKAIPDEIREIVQNWATLVGQVDPPLKVYLRNARLSLGGDNKLMIVVQDGLPYDSLMKPENQARVESMLSEYIQKEVSVHIQKIDQHQDFEANYVDLSKIINMDIEIEED